MKNDNISPAERTPWQKGILAVHTQSGVSLSTDEHQKLVDGPIAAVSDDVEAARKRVDVTPRFWPMSR